MREDGSSTSTESSVPIAEGSDTLDDATECRGFDVVFEVEDKRRKSRKVLLDFKRTVRTVPAPSGLWLFLPSLISRFSQFPCSVAASGSTRNDCGRGERRRMLDFFGLSDGTAGRSSVITGTDGRRESDAANGKFFQDIPGGTLCGRGIRDASVDARGFNLGVEGVGGISGIVCAFVDFYPTVSS